MLAIDKSAAKILQINCNAKKLGLENINAFVYDAVKAVKIDEDEDVSIDESEPKSPPFPSKSFDRILLDAPCRYCSSDFFKVCTLYSLTIEYDNLAH